MADVEYQREKPQDEAQDEDSGLNSCIGGLIWIISVLLIICTFPFSLCVCVKMVQEYERAVIFRLGRVKKGLNTNCYLFMSNFCNTYQLLKNELKSFLRKHSF